MNKISDAMFGENVLDEAIGWIMGEALKANTEEAYEAAALQLQGISRLWDTFRGRQDYKSISGLFESLAITNSWGQMRRYAQNEDLRAEYAAATCELRRA